MSEKWTTEQAMALAIEEAQRGTGFVSPNPLVGCVILDKDGRLISKGAHLRFGGPHAEINALSPLLQKQLLQKDQTDSLAGATLIVTLEPCAHEGKTPSCAKALAKWPLAKVIFGLVDPNPLVAGQGQKILLDAGIECVEYQGPLKQNLENLCEHFLINQRLGRPFISLKVATSLDGQLALKNGESKWITGEPARRWAHQLRAAHEAILVGQGTIEKDNPSLDIRHPEFPQKQNLVIILLSKSRPLDIGHLKILQTHKPEEVYFLLPHPEGWQRQVITDATNPTMLAPSAERYDPWFRQIGPAGFKPKFLANSILVEGGAGVLSSFVNDGRCDRLYLFQSPVIIGAGNGKSWTELVKIDFLSQKIQLKQDLLTPLGDDLLWTGRFQKVEV